MRITSAILFSVFLLPLLFSACKSGKEQVPPLPDPSELIAEQRMKTIREHRTRCETGLARHLATTEQTRVPETEVKIAVPAGTGH